MPLPHQDQAAAYRALKAAYAEAHAKGEGANDLSRALINNYVATSSRAVSDEIQALQDPALGAEADRFATAAERKDQVRTGLGIGKIVWKFVGKFLPGSMLAAAAVAAIGFVIALLGEANQAGEHAGAALAGAALSGGVILFLFRAAAAAAKGAAQVGESLMASVGEAFQSNATAKRVVQEVGAAESRFLGQGPALQRARRGRIVVTAAGPATGVGLSVLIAIPLIFIAVSLAGTVTGYGKSVEESSTLPSFEYTPSYGSGEYPE